MTSADLKLNLFRTLDKLKKSELSEVSGIINNYISEHHPNLDWERLSEEEKMSLIEAKHNIRTNGGTPHSKAMKKFRKRFTNA